MRTHLHKKGCPTSGKAQRLLTKQIGQGNSLLGRARVAAAQATLERCKRNRVLPPTQLALHGVDPADIVSGAHSLPAAARLRQSSHAPFAKAAGAGGSGRDPEQVRQLLAADAARRAARAAASATV